MPWDGEGRLVFQLSSGGDLYTARPDGGQLQWVGRGLDPAWSPDGRKIAYSSWDYPQGIYVADADGGNPKKVTITSFPHEVPTARSPQWSPDERYIAFHEFYQQWRNVWRIVEGRPLLVAVLFDLWRVSFVDLESGQVHGVDADDVSLTPSWGPDGRLAFKGIQGINIVSGDTDQRRVEKVAGSDARFASPDWSSDGERFTFMWRQHDHWEIGVMGADGGGFRLLTSSPPFTRPANNVSPAWSPDGSRIAFLSDRTGQWRLFTMNADGSNQQMIDLGDLEFNYEFVHERVVSWGP
jgi:TolB protein